MPMPLRGDDNRHGRLFDHSGLVFCCSHGYSLSFSCVHSVNSHQIVQVPAWSKYVPEAGPESNIFYHIAAQFS